MTHYQSPVLNQLNLAVRERLGEILSERERSGFKATGDLRYLVLAIGRYGATKWALEACREFAEDYATSLARFDDEQELGRYPADLPLLVEMGDLIVAGRGVYSAANEVAERHKTPETEAQIGALTRRLYNIWRRTGRVDQKDHRWRSAAIRRFLRSPRAKAAVQEALRSERTQALAARLKEESPS